MPPEADKRLVQLDGLRGFAVLGVMCYHFFNLQMNSLEIVLNPAEHFLMVFSFFGKWGVDVFFVLSGFLIGRILLANRYSGNYFKVFYIRRFFRIIPVYYLLVTIYFLSIKLPFYDPAIFIFSNPISPIYYFTFTQNIVMAARENFGPFFLSQTWSLAVEEQFYLIIPLIIHLVREPKLPYLIGLFIFAAPAFRYFFNSDIPSYTLLLSRIDAPAMGLLLAWMLSQKTIENYIRENIKKLRLVSLVLIPGCFALYNLGYSGVFSYTLVAFISWQLLLHCLFSAETWLFRPFKAKWLVALGNISYFVYLFHQPLNALLHLLILKQPKPILDSMADFFTTLVGLAITIVLAMLSYNFIEKPLIKYSHTFKYAA